MLTDANFEPSNGIAEPFHYPPPFEPAGPGEAVFEEAVWREPKAKRDGAEITLSRWTAARGNERTESAVTPDHSHIVALALCATRVSLWSGSRSLFEGTLPAGTIFVSAPGQRLRVRITPPFDFLHFHVGNRLLCEEGLIADEDDFSQYEDIPPFRDPLAEALGRSLLEEDVHRFQPEYATVVARAIVMRAIGRKQTSRRCCALPKWRMKRLEQYLADNIDGRVSLNDMASAVGLSKMHFAAQFRAATGFRPREYLLFKRIERAKTVMTATSMPLVEVAFSVGFNAQAHFSTVFKRFTGKTPAQWKQECQRAA